MAGQAPGLVYETGLSQCRASDATLRDLMTTNEVLRKSQQITDLPFRFPCENR